MSNSIIDSLKIPGGFDRFLPNKVILSPSADHHFTSFLSSRECLHDISKAFKAGGVSYKDGMPYQVLSYNVRATVVDGKVLVETREDCSEATVRILFAQYLPDPTPVEKLVAEFQISTSMAFIESYHNKNQDKADKEAKKANEAIEKAYNLAREEGLPEFIINRINYMKNK